MTFFPLQIGIAGLGTVGQAVARLLREKADLLEKRAGRRLELSAVSSRDRNKAREADLSGAAWHENTLGLADDPNIGLVAELIGGADGIAYDLVKRALANKKHVVTANKALIAKHGVELALLAEKNGVALMFEAAVAGGIPILKALREGLAANRFTRICGILNGTCNYILSEMEREGRDFAKVLKEAQTKGYAETPPDLDIDGIDAAHKLAILAGIAHGGKVAFDNVYIEGIRNVSLSDIQYAKELGYRIRLLGIVRDNDGLIEQRVHPCLIPASSPLAAISGVTNAALVECDTLGPALFTGAGAGGGPTASAVVADIIDIARGHIAPPFGVPAERLETLRFCAIAEHQGEYYVRLLVRDQPGVLASITSLFSAERIGVGSVLQKADEVKKTAQIALITHKTGETAIQKALTNIAGMDYVREKPHMIRVEK